VSKISQIHGLRSLRASVGTFPGLRPSGREATLDVPCTPGQHCTRSCIPLPPLDLTQDNRVGFRMYTEHH